ncbi:hypothetical protein HS088_TW01G00214 [Tripterygium wilfordii]|uniref:F28L1.9 protein n=1 Tax=Tripterygium wilfordii TaxID=458696 RepID=A0A7J7E1Y0_TRIWF|nr:uncharacterized protein LOC119999919 [Tripterygium wilfordii]KAF5752306.1 hypothetical protein HS088_TW01G00214 [Tripterygium wilfordii]
MPEKGVILQFPNSWTLRSSPFLQWRLPILTAFVLVAMVVVWSIDGCTIKSFIETRRFKQDYVPVRSNTPTKNLTETAENSTPSATNIQVNLARKPSNVTNETQFIDYRPISVQNSSGFEDFEVSTNVTKFSDFNPVSVQNSTGFSQSPLVSTNVTEVKDYRPVSAQNSSVFSRNPQVLWLSDELEPNLTANLLSRWLAPGGEPCRDSRTVQISVPGLDGGDLVKLSAGDSHEFVFQALDESGNARCLGGDYFETDLSGEAWKSRPVVKDFGNGSYSISLQVHQDFAGDYNVTIILLFRHFEGLKFSPGRFAFDKELRRIPIRFIRSETLLPELQICQKSDFNKDVWVGRWTRHGKNDDCQISNDGRYRCLAPDFPCQSPWCNGSLGLLESNGWVYSTHCSFRLFSSESAWNCLRNRWIFFWGDSNHVDTIRNMLNFVLDLPDIHSVPRRFDMNFSNPRDPSQTVRITSIFNGHWNETGNYQGLNSLQDEGFRNLLWKYFSEATVPDTVIMNSGLHDGVFWHNIRGFSHGAEYAVSFWKEVMDSVRQRGLVVPQIFYRTTVATGGYARTLAFNPNKMEAFNRVVLDKLKQAGLVSGTIDDFDMTFPWHFDNRCNDGVHYGRAPLKMKWRDGEIGHQYFVDLMLAHVLLNTLCTR